MNKITFLFVPLLCMSAQSWAAIGLRFKGAVHGQSYRAHMEFQRQDIPHQHIFVKEILLTQNTKIHLTLSQGSTYYLYNMNVEAWCDTIKVACATWSFGTASLNKTSEYVKLIKKAHNTHEFSLEYCAIDDDKLE